MAITFSISTDLLLEAFNAHKVSFTTRSLGLTRGAEFAEKDFLTENRETPILYERLMVSAIDSPTGARLLLFVVFSRQTKNQLLCALCDSAVRYVMRFKGTNGNSFYSPQYRIITIPSGHK